jgi:hypothetical protein
MAVRAAAIEEFGDGQRVARVHRGGVPAVLDHPEIVVLEGRDAVNLHHGGRVY